MCKISVKMAASKPLYTEEPLSRLLECAVCQNPVTNHRALPCIHSFCQSCLEPLVKNDSIICPVCREICLLKGRDVSDLPRNLLLRGILDQCCVQCQTRSKEVYCQHCNKHLCKVCHEVCRDEVSGVRDQLQAETRDLLSEGHQTLHQIHQDTVRIHNQVTTISEQIDQTTQTLLENFPTRHRQLKQELVKEGNTEIDRLNTQYQQLYDLLGKLKAFSDISHTQLQQDLGDVNYMCEKWREETCNTKKISQTTGQVNIEYISDIQHTVDINCKYGQIQTNKVRSATSLITKKRSAATGATIQERSATGMTSDINNSVTRCQKASKRYPSVSIDYRSKGVPRYVLGRKGSQRGQFYCPARVAVSPVSGNVVICDKGNNRIQIYTDRGQFVSEFGSKAQAERQIDFNGSISFTCTGGVCVTAGGMIVVADTDNHRLQTFTEHGQFISVIGQKGTRPGQFQHPLGLSCDHTGRIYVCDRDNHRIQVLEQDGTVVKVFGTQDEMGDWRPSGIDICPDGDVVVAAGRTGKIEVFTAGGQLKTTLTNDNVKAPLDVAVDRDSNIIVNDWDTHQVHVLRQSGELICSWGGKGRKPGELNFPDGVCCTTDGQVVVADFYNDRVQYF